MRGNFYLLKGIKFWDWHRTMKTLCDFTIHPVSAPLGEEVTRHDNFKGASCRMFIRFPTLAQPQTVWCDFNPLRDPQMEKTSKFHWNPDGDSLIHHIHMGVLESELNMEHWSVRPEKLDIARATYILFKSVFLTFSCDEAEGIDENLSQTFYWKKGAAIQIVIYPLEDRREMTEEEYLNRSWIGPRESALVFNIHSSRDGKAQSY